MRAKIKVVAKKRDELRDLQFEIQDQCENMDESIELMEAALDKLSELLWYNIERGKWLWWINRNMK